MRNAEIADALEELGTLYELDGANRYRVLAYRQAARAIREQPAPVAELSAAGRLTELEGIGDTLAEKITALLTDGEIPAAAKLKERIPPGLVEVTHLPGVGAKTAARLHTELGISTLEELAEAAKAGKLRTVKGMGPKAEANVIASIERLEAEGPAERRLVPEVEPLGAEIVSALRALPECEAAEVAGSVRRLADTCKDVDIAAGATDADPLLRALAGHELIESTESSGPGGARASAHNGVRIELRVVPPESFGSLLQHLTGSAAHNVELRERAVKRGLSVSEHGIAADGADPEPCATEQEVYERLGLAYIPPELREGAGEIAAAGELPGLVELSDVRGELHCHTTLSDGHNSLTEMAEAARERKLDYIAITDHSASHGFGDDVQADELLERLAEIRDLDIEGIEVLCGSEVNIAPDGSLDYADEVLEQLDWVIASVHTSFRMSAERMTDRVVSAMEHPLVDCIGHLTGRLLLKREPYDLDVGRVVEAAADTGTMLEINGNPRRRDLSSPHARLAGEAGVPIVLNTDAHRTGTLANLRWAVATARRAWLGPDRIANARPWAELDAMRKTPRNR